MLRRSASFQGKKSLADNDNYYSIITKNVFRQIPAFSWIFLNIFTSHGFFREYRIQSFLRSDLFRTIFVVFFDEDLPLHNFLLYDLISAALEHYNYLSMTH